jgi:antitoxin CptB
MDPRLRGGDGKPFDSDKPMNRDTRLKRLNFRASHRGTREADMMIGGFCEARCESWNEEQIVWFEALLEEQDVDIMAWALGAQPTPIEWQGQMMDDMRRMDFVKVAR